MALTESKMLPLGTKAPSFNLPDTVSGKTISSDDIFSGKATVVMFICNHCPFVIHVNSKLVSLANTYTKKGISFIAISSNDVINYPQDGPDQMKIHAKNENYPFPYLYDETQDIAKAYDAACTPDLYIFDYKLKLAYRGQLDDSRPDNGLPVTGRDLIHAIDCIIEGKESSSNQKPSIGCNIKWKN